MTAAQAPRCAFCGRALSLFRSGHCSPECAEKDALRALAKSHGLVSAEQAEPCLACAVLREELAGEREAHLTVRAREAEEQSRRKASETEAEILRALRESMLTPPEPSHSELCAIGGVSAADVCTEEPENPACTCWILRARQAIGGTTVAPIPFVVARVVAAARAVVREMHDPRTCSTPGCPEPIEDLPAVDVELLDAVRALDAEEARR